MGILSNLRALHDILEARTLEQPVRHWIARLRQQHVV